jgi:hypothetical protein
MDIDKLTIGEAEIAWLFGRESNGPWVVGQNYHIRTVTHYWTGRLVYVGEQELVLEDAAWIADTGRFADMFTNGPSEVEPVEGRVIIGRGAVVDAQEWQLQLPRKQQ